MYWELILTALNCTLRNEVRQVKYIQLNH